MTNHPTFCDYCNGGGQVDCSYCDGSGLYTRPANQEAGAVLSIVERLRARLPICPFDPKAPKHDLEASDPCPVCSDYGDERSKNLCRGADTRVMDEAADTIEDLVEALKEARNYVEACSVYVKEQRGGRGWWTCDQLLANCDALLAKLEGDA